MFLKFDISSQVIIKTIGLSAIKARRNKTIIKTIKHQVPCTEDLLYGRHIFKIFINKIQDTHKLF